MTDMGHLVVYVQVRVNKTCHKKEYGYKRGALGNFRTGKCTAVKKMCRIFHAGTNGKTTWRCGINVDF